MLTGKLQQASPVPRKALVMPQFNNLRTGAGLCMMRPHWSLSEPVYINMPLVIIALTWLFSRAFLRVTLRSHSELKVMGSKISANPRNALLSSWPIFAIIECLTESNGLQTSIITLYYTTRSEGRQDSCSRNKGHINFEVQLTYIICMHFTELKK